MRMVRYGTALVYSYSLTLILHMPEVSNNGFTVWTSVSASQNWACKWLKFMRGSQSEETVVLRERSKNGMHHKTAQNPPLFYYLFKKTGLFLSARTNMELQINYPWKRASNRREAKWQKVFRSGWWAIVLTPLGVRAMWSPKFVNVVIWKLGNVGFSK